MANNVRDIVVNSLKFYDKHAEANNKIFHDFKYFSLETTGSDFKHSKINLYDKNKQLIKKYNMEVIGIYNVSNNLWTWAWAYPKISKKFSQLSRNILNYGLDMVSSRENLFLKTELITSRFIVNDPIQLDIHLAISAYLTKNEKIFPLILTAEEDIIMHRAAPRKLVKDMEKAHVIQWLFLIEDQ